MQRKMFLKKMLWGLASFSFCLALYLSLAFLMLRNDGTAADSKVSDVPYGETAGEFSLLLACEELSQYCGVTVYPEEKQITAVLFDNRTDAEGYRERYSRRIEYRKNTEIDVIGRIGGIVIRTGSGYNESDTGSQETQRLFGSRVLELARESDKRAEIAKELLSSLLSVTLDSTDFNYIFASCSTDVSYVDFCEYFPLLQTMRDNITVTIG